MQILIVIFIIFILGIALVQLLGQLLLFIGRSICTIVALLSWILALILFLILQLVATLIIVAIALLITVVVPALIIWLSYETIKYVSKNIRTNLFFAILLVICTGGMGTSLGFWFIRGKLDILIINSLLLTSIPIVAILFYLPIEQAREIINYRNKEKNLIQS